MSAIASFYLIDDGKRDALLAAAQAQTEALTRKRWGLFRPRLPLKFDPFWDFLGKNTRELEDYPYSGYLFLDVELLAPEALSSEEELGKRLSEITQSTFVSYRPSDAAKTISMLGTADFSEDTIQKFLTEEGRQDEYPDAVAPLQEAVKLFTRWLGAVTAGNTGVLHIG